MNTLFLMVARGGSTGVPKKNLREIAGLSLIGYKAIGARAARHCGRLMISTDSPEIQAEARRFGVEVPFSRPAALATDDAPSVDVVLHAMDWVEQNIDEDFDSIMLLEPSAPFTRAEDYDRAVDLMAEKQASVVVGVREVTIGSVFLGPLDEAGRMATVVDKIKGIRKLRRQDFEAEYTMNAALYLMDWGFLSRSRQIYDDPAGTYGLVMPPEYSVEIDTPLDLHWAEFLVERGIVDPAPWLRAVPSETST